MTPAPDTIKDDAAIITKSLPAFGIPLPCKVYPLHKNNSRSVYRVVDAKRNTYVVHLSDDCDIHHIYNEQQIQQQLADSPLYTYILLCTTENIPYIQSGPHIITVYEWITGKHPDTANMDIEQCSALGRALAIFHSNVTKLSYDNNNQLLINDVGALVAIYQHKYDDLDYKELLSFIKPLEILQTAKGIVHGDFHSNNILINNNMVYVLDLERVGTGAFIYDIARAALDICAKGEQFDIDMCTAFLHGYQQINTINKEELSHFVHCVVYASLAVSDWFYDRQHYETARRFVNIGLDAKRRLATS